VELPISLPVKDMPVRRIVFATLCALAAASPSHAQTGPVIVVPGKPGVPVIINGVIADGAVVYGDWGLARPGHGELIIQGPVGFPAATWSPGYYPSAGHPPRIGRLEVEPARKQRPVNTDFHRAWTESDPSQAVTTYPPFEPPPVIVAPRGRKR
jgi:hypothetical protein